MTAAEIRQSFLEFFRAKQHTIVPSASLLPDSPNLLFTNAGMNQFVPIFLGQQSAPWSPPRTVDTQKCIRAGGKHNDLDDVGLDTYHHTFFEMLGNWSFGDYFKKEAIEWAWELVVERWGLPPQRLYATVYKPGPGDPSEFDQEAHDHWAGLFTKAGLNPTVHVVNGNKKDNFWMMGDTGPCGPCSELHVDLTPAGDTQGALVNAGDARCIEIWNLVFIQFNANPDGTFVPLPARHVDTGMGFERVTAMIQGTKDFTDFSRLVSNYETDVFRPIFDEIEKLSGKKYASTLPKAGSGGEGEQEKIDVAFRVIADHIRTLSFAIADGIQPGNTDRSYVLRRILRRAVRYGRVLNFHEPFFFKLVDVLAGTMGDVFVEIRAKQKHVEEVLKREEEMFNKTLDRGIEIFGQREGMPVALLLNRMLPDSMADMDKTNFLNFVSWGWAEYNGLRAAFRNLPACDTTSSEIDAAVRPFLPSRLALRSGIPVSAAEISELKILPGSAAFELYDTYGFPLDLTELMARERGLTVDVAGFEKLMNEQRARARAAQKKEVISVSDDNLQLEPTKFLGYDFLETEAVVESVTAGKHAGELNVVLDRTACYAEMGGQVGDHGSLHVPGHDRTEVGQLAVLDTQKRGNVFIHRAKLTDGRAPEPGEAVRISVDAGRRNAIQRHHTVTHLLHWALHEVVSREAAQKGSYVGAEKLTFDFNGAALAPEQVRDVEKLVNERVIENGPVSWTEMPYAEVKARPDIMQFFGDKYGDTVRVVQIGGQARGLNGYSMELCGGTHVRGTGEIGLFRIASEAAIAAGVRRIEAQAGLHAYHLATNDTARLHALATKLGTPLPELEKRIEGLLTQQKELEKALKAASQREAAARAKDLLRKVEMVNGRPTVIANLGISDGDFVQSCLDALKNELKEGVVVLGGASSSGSVFLSAGVTASYISQVSAGKIISAIAPLVGGKGGGKPEGARGGGKDPSQLDAALAHAKALLG